MKDKRVLKNPTRICLKTIFRGRTEIFGAKHGVAFDMNDEEEKALYNHWIETYGFLYDITKNLKEGGKL